MAVIAMQVVVAPHVYPPSISKATSNYAGSGLFSRLSTSFGTLNKQGFCLSDGTCHQFAIAIGETGTAFENALDTPAMADFASYLTNTGEFNAMFLQGYGCIQIETWMQAINYTNAFC